MPLTDKQKQFYNNLLAFFRTNLRMPTHREAAELNNLKSANSSVQYHRACVDKGVLKKDKRGNYTFANPADVWLFSRSSSKSIPILGEISAGTLHEVIQTDLGEVTIRDVFSGDGRIFGLRVRGESMKGLGLATGDTVILSKTELRDGEVGAVLYNGKTTLKRAHVQEAGLRLEPANPDFDDIMIEPGEFEEVRVIGKYLGYISEEGVAKSSY